MKKTEGQDIRTLLKRYDPLLVAAARGDEAVTTGVIAEEVTRNKDALKGFDAREVARAAADYLGEGSVVFSCGGPVCICPEDSGCGAFTVRADIDRTVYRLGASMFEAVSELDAVSKGGAVVGVGDRLGYAGLCIDTVQCTGKNIFVMHRCRQSLYAFDIREGVVDPIDAILAIAKDRPPLAKRVQAMIKEMEKEGELPR